MMTQREKNLTFYVILFGVVGCLLLVLGYYYWSESSRYAEELAAGEEKIQAKRKEMHKFIGDMHQKMDLYQALSLPSSPDVAGREYFHFLRTLMTDSGFQAVYVPQFSIAEKAVPKSAQNIRAPKGKKEKEVTPIYTSISFPLVRGEVSLANLTKFLDRFERAPLLHQIKTLTVEPAEKTSGESSSTMLSVKMNIEALIVEDANKPETLVGIDERLIPFEAFAGMWQRPIGIALVPWAVGPSGPFYQQQLAKQRPKRDYTQITNKNIFVGYVPPPPPMTPKIVDPPDDPIPEDTGPDVKEFVRLMMITIDEERAEAKINNRLGGRDYRLRTTPGFDYFRITSESGTEVLKGKVIHIDYRDVYFVWSGNIYCFHIGDTLAQAVQRPMTKEEIEKAGIAVPK